MLATATAHRLKCELKWRVGSVRHTKFPGNVLSDPIFEMRQNRMAAIRASSKRFKVQFSRLENWKGLGGLAARIRDGDMDDSKTSLR